MSTDHRKPVVAFVMLALAAGLVVGVQQAEAQGGRLLAAAAGVGAHVQGTISSPSETVGSRAHERLADLGPTFVSVREAVGHADVSTVSTHVGTRAGTRSGAQPVASTRPGPAAAPRTGPGDRSSGKAATVRSAAERKAPERGPGNAESRPASPRKAGPVGRASTPSAGKARGKSSSPVAKTGPRPAASDRSTRPGRRPARVAATSRATGVPASASKHGKAHGRHHGQTHGRR